MIVQLESIMTHYSEIISRKFNHNFTDQPGFGAAGGLGYAISVFINSELKRGINIVLETLNFKQYLVDAELVVTGEGQIDSQSERGKAPIGVINYAKQYNCRIFVIAGSVDDPKTFIKKFGINNTYSIVNDELSIKKALENPYGNLKVVSKTAAEDYKNLVS